jgi:dTDP-4-amino-4,6-dideoxygalactose transaminase
MDKSYLQLYNKAEELLDNIGISPAASRDVCLASKLDSNYIIDRRKINAKIIMNAFPELLIFPEVKESDCPMFVPILLPAEKRNGLRQYLIKNDIYCPIHWPVSNYHRLDERTRILYDSELSLVCDQRYSEKDMYHMIDIIDRFFRRDSSCL